MKSNVLFTSFIFSLGWQSSECQGPILGLNLTYVPSSSPSPQPSTQPTPRPSAQPSPPPSTQPSAQPSPRPSAQPSPQPSTFTPIPTSFPSTTTHEPTMSPMPTPHPSHSFTPTVLPTASPTLSRISELNSWKYILDTMQYYTYFFIAQYLLFETFRGTTYVYSSRCATYSKRCRNSHYEPPVRRSRFPLSWVMPLLRMSDDRLLFLVGLDAFVMIRYVRLCWKICAMSTFICCAVLVPVYSSGQQKKIRECELDHQEDDTICQEQDFSIYTLMNDIDAHAMIAVGAAYLLAFQVCYLVREEYRWLRDQRTAYFVRGDPQTEIQTLYTVMVENVPVQYRLNVEFRALFDTLFPGAVHSSEVMQPLSSLSDACSAAEKCAMQLEDALVARQQGGKEPTVLVGPWYQRLFSPFYCTETQISSAVTYWRTELKLANQRIAELQKRHFEQVIPLEEKARQRLKGINANGTSNNQTPSFASPRVRARSEGNLNLRETTTDSSFADASLTSTLLATGEDDSLTVSRHGGLRSTVHENLKDMDFQFSPFLGEMDDRLKSMLLNLAAAGVDGQESDKLKLNPLPPPPPPRAANGNMARQVSDPLTGGNASVGATTISTNSQTSYLFPDRNQSRRQGNSIGSGSGLIDKLKHSLNKKISKAKEMTDLFATGPAPLRAGSTGFVTFNSLTAATSACQLTLSHKSFTLQTKRAPEPSGLLWHNVMVGNKSAATRKFMARLILNSGAIVFAIAVAGFAALGNPNSIGIINSDGEQSKYVSWLNLNEQQLQYACSYVPATLGLGLLLIVPWIFLFVASTYESYKSKVDVEISIFKRYFSYYMAYIFITSITFAIVPLSKKLRSEPSEGLSELVADLAVSFSKASGYFITVLTLKIFFGTTWELSRPWALLSKSIAKGCVSKNKIGKRHRDESNLPDPCRYGWIYPQLLVVIAITITYQVITPFMAPFGLAYFSMSLLVYQQQALYVYVNDYESGGEFLPLLLERTLHIASGSQILLAFFLLISSSSSPGAFTAFLFAAPLPLATLFFTNLLKRAYQPMLDNLTYDVALYIDQVRKRQDRMSGTNFQQYFSSYRYMQPWLTQLPVSATAVKVKNERRSINRHTRKSSSGSVRGSLLAPPQVYPSSSSDSKSNSTGKKMTNPLSASLLPDVAQSQEGVLVSAEPQWQGEGDSGGPSFEDGQYDIEEGDGDYLDDDEDMRSDIGVMDQSEVEELVYSMLHPDQVDQVEEYNDSTEESNSLTNRPSGAALFNHDNQLPYRDNSEYAPPTFSALRTKNDKPNRRRAGSTSAQAAAEALAGGWAPAQGWKRQTASPTKQGGSRRDQSGSGSVGSQDDMLI